MRFATTLALLLAAAPALAQEEPAEPAAEDGSGSEEPAAEEGGEDAAPTGEEPAAEEPAPAEPVATEGGGDAAPTEDAPAAEEVAPAADDTAALLARVEALEAALDLQREDIATTKLALVPPDEMQFDLEGYYRTRGYVYNRLFSSQVDENGDYNGDATYMAHRMKVRPVFNYKDLAKAMFEIDMFGDPMFGKADAVWGDNQSRQPTSLFATDPSNTAREGNFQTGGPRLTRAWMEFSIPVGLLRVGRQASDWGMGLLANNGDGFDDPFGENHFGATFDRAIFATKPIAIAQAISGKDGPDVPLFLAVGVDRLVEDPMFQYYGYKCDPEDDDDDPRCGPNDDHNYQDEDVDESIRRNDWFADRNDDVKQMIYVLIYRGEDVKVMGKTGDITAGAYVVNRTQKETDSNIVIADVYTKIKFSPIDFEFEGLTIQGRTSALALAGAINVADDDPLFKNTNIFGYVGRLGYERGGLRAVFEHGYASGDDNPADEMFTVRPIAPDHNVGLILYEDVISRVTANGWTESARGLWSNGGVYNSRYIFPHATIGLIDNWNVVLGGVMAWPDRPDGAFVRCREGDYDDDRCFASAEDSMLGWEVDAGLHMNWHKHLRLALETGYAHATDRLPLENAGLNPNGNFYTFQVRMAYEFGPIDD